MEIGLGGHAGLEGHGGRGPRRHGVLLRLRERLQAARDHRGRRRHPQRAALASEILADIKGDDEDLDLKKPTGSRRKAIGFLAKVACGTYLMYDDIVHDPPDPDYKHVTDAGAGQPLLPAERVPGGQHRGDDARGRPRLRRRAPGRLRALPGRGRGRGRAAGPRSTPAASASRRSSTQHRMRRLGRELRAAAPHLEDPEIEAATPRTSTRSRRCASGSARAGSPPASSTSSTRSG